YSAVPRRALHHRSFRNPIFSNLLLTNIPKIARGLVNSVPGNNALQRLFQPPSGPPTKLRMGLAAVKFEVMSLMGVHPFVQLPRRSGSPHCTEAFNQPLNRSGILLRRTKIPPLRKPCPNLVQPLSQQQIA